MAANVVKLDSVTSVKGSTSKLMPNGVKVNDATGELIVAVVDGVTQQQWNSKTRSLFIWKSC